jgi:hypothetical protein
VLDCTFEHRTGPAEAVAGIEQAIDLRTIPRPLVDFVEAAVVGVIVLSDCSWKSISSSDRLLIVTAYLKIGGAKRKPRTGEERRGGTIIC